ncbi:peptidoglycan-binding domain-containing protein [Variovorax sp. J22R133]|uniref:peptidoglycan-binding domain-containing protein n=1 Tax=Variovorax brevis TaxID=3053503 RepID=UPI0025790DB7|nr:peptidoglycan-binding domain-containing protein [Variovorax sp. J22R133]MDM0116624.1 peptidoglycan-binding domain-containing protein [Variovorax sp. J22R133]
MESASSIADAFDAKRLKRVKDLEEWVQDNPQWWAVALATTGATAMEFTGGYVDLLRLGEGVAEGSWSGAGKDALRLLSLLGPMGRVTGKLTPLLRQQQLLSGLRLAVKPAGISGPCTFQAANNVAQLAKGKSVFVTITDMARARGKQVADLAVDDKGRRVLAAFIDDLLPTLRAAGVQARRVIDLKNVEDVVKLTRGTRRVVVFAFEVAIKGKEKPIRHSVMAFRDTAGQVRFADYGGKVFESLEALVQRWGQASQPFALMQKNASAVMVETGHIDGIVRNQVTLLTHVPALVLQGVELIETAFGGAELAVPVTLAAAALPAASDPSPSAVIVESFDNFVLRKGGEAPRASARPASGVPRSDWLTGVQYRLNHLGYGAGPVDGAMGPRTERAVRSFQKDNSPLKPDAIPGPRTQARLAAVCGY